jgi:hypothetical protein
MFKRLFKWLGWYLEDVELLGTIPHPQYPRLSKWLFKVGSELAYGDGGSYRYINGKQLNLDYRIGCLELVKEAEVLKASGKQYRQYQWSEIINKESL